MSIFAKQADGSNKNMSDRSDIKVLTSEGYTITDTDEYDIFIVTTGASDRTINLPQAVNNKGRKLTFVKADDGAGEIILEPYEDETVNNKNAASILLQNNLLEIISDGTEWFIISSFTHHDQFIHEYLGTKLIDPVDCTSNQFTITTSDQIRSLYVTTRGNDITVDLPTAADNESRVLFIVKDDAIGSVIIDPEGTEEIGGAQTYTLTDDDETVRIMAASGEWVIISTADVQADQIVVQDVPDRFQDVTVEDCLMELAGPGRTYG